MSEPKKDVKPVVKTEEKVNWNEIAKKAGKRAMGGGIAGSLAMVINVTTMMWLRTTMNYQYLNGTTTMQTLKILYKEGGIPRFYKGIGPALFQGPLARFGDTAANVGILALLEANEKTKKLPVAVKTLCASLAASCWRIFLMPIDTTKTFLQVQGNFADLMVKVRKNGFSVMYHGALGAATATYWGHFPWFFTNNFLSEKLPEAKAPVMRFARRAFIGFISSVVSDSFSNSLRVCKVYKQASAEAISYPMLVKNVIAKEGIWGLMGRGLKTRIISNGCQGIVFNILWKYLMDVINKRNGV